MAFQVDRPEASVLSPNGSPARAAQNRREFTGNSVEVACSDRENP
jgi:hypothetical protein